MTNVVRLGESSPSFTDLYHRLVSLSWPGLLALIASGYLCLNVVFAIAFLAGGNDIANARPGSFFDAFNFSIQTMAGIGYGNMSPTTPFAHALVTLESMVSLLGLAVATGIIFSKFARPTSRVMFSDVLVISDRNAVPSLIFRASNQRSNFIVHPHMSIALIRTEVTLEGETLRRIHDLKLERGNTPFFALTWTLVHPITPDSPLYGKTHDDLVADDTMIVASLMGHDESYGQAIHAQNFYTTAQVLYRRRFVDVLGKSEDGTLTIDLTHFHQTQEWTLSESEMGIGSKVGSGSR